MQLVYNEVADDGFAGLLGDAGEGQFLISRAFEGVAAIAFGLGVIYGTDPDKQFDRFSGAGTLAGILAHKQNRSQPALATTLGIVQTETASLVRNGRIWVVTEEPIVVGDAVFVRHTTGGGGTQIGAFRNDADTATAQSVPEASWLKSGSTTGIALLQINLP